jgi:predicted transcriptional regulator
MHFGKIVKEVAYAQNLSAGDLASLLGCTEKEVLESYEREEWTSNAIKAASIALEHNFGKHLDNTLPFDFLNTSSTVDKSEYLITVKYPKGKEQLLKTWLSKMAMIAKAIGLEIGR